MALISTATVKSFLGINTADPTWDARLTSWIAEASTYIERYVGQPIESETKTNWVFSGNGGRTFHFPYWPVTALALLQRRASGWGSDATWETVETDTYEFVSDPASGYYIDYEERFIRGRRNYRATFTVGYTTIPEDIQMVCREMVAKVKLESPAPEGGGRFGLASKSDAIAGVTHGTSYLDMEPRWKKVLDRYKAIPFAQY